MCWCTPNIRTPNCGKPECHPAANSHQNSHQNSHTQEPWKYTERLIFGDAHAAIVGADGSVIASTEDYYPVTEENQRRIVACVNACVGVPREKLETTATMPRLATKSLENLERAQKAEAQLAAVTAQRDELLAALKVAADYVYREVQMVYTDSKMKEIADDMMTIDAAIAKCEVQNDG